MSRLAILGASSCIGHHLCHAVTRVSGHEVLGSYRRNRPLLDIPTFSAENGDWLKFDRRLRAFIPTHIFNLLRGEDDDGLTLHWQLIAFCDSHDVHYCYASSFNAVDGNVTVSHLDSDPPNAVSTYGQFKATCERALRDTLTSHSVFRFPTAPAWAPFYVGKAERFLQRMQAGERVVVDTGMVMNRVAAPLLVKMMLAVAEGRGQGVFNLGSVDWSDELDFKRNLAVEFGYSPSQVVEGDHSPCNAVMLPERLLAEHGAEQGHREAETITILRNTPELQQYIFCSKR